MLGALILLGGLVWGGGEALAGYLASDVAQRVAPAVVGVWNLAGGAGGHLQVKGSGSGLILRRDGYIITNYHVIAGAAKVRIALASGQQVPATVVGHDALTDLALLHIAGKGLPAARLADRLPTVGTPVVAIGNPGGPHFGWTVTTGVVSGLNRNLGTGYARWAIDLIQTDAAINPGNSGGPLCGPGGQVIGINSVKIAQVGVEGMGFAIPAPTVRQVYESLLHHRAVIRPWLGVTVAAPTGEEGADAPLRITGIFPGGPAAQKNIRLGDRLLEVDGRRLPSLTDLFRLLANSRVGQKVTLTIGRGPNRHTVTVQLGRLPSGMRVA